MSPRPWIRSGLPALVAAALAAAPAARAAAPDLVVNSATDGDDGACTTGPAGCTLREAINAVNAGTERSIGFDPAVFVLGTPTTILLTTPLPAIGQSGVSVDGTGAGVRLDGDDAAVGAGLAFRTPVGVALSGVRVRNLAIADFVQGGLFVCPGGIECVEALSDVTVENVVSESNGSDGIRIDATTTSSVAVRSSVARGNAAAGIVINALENNSNVSVVDCSVEQGIRVNAGNDLTAPVLTGNVVLGSAFGGIVVNAGQVVSKARISGNRVLETTDAGIQLSAGGDLVAPRVENNQAIGGGAEGILIAPGDLLSQGRVTGNTAIANAGFGIRIGGPTRTLVSANRADRNLGGILLADAGEGSRVKSNVAHDNLGFGIRVALDQAGVRVTGNRALGNGTLDLDDENQDCGENRWSRNTALVAGSPCVLGVP